MEVYHTSRLLSEINLRHFNKKTMRIIKTIFLFLICHLSMAQSPVIDSIFMGAGYANQIYYKLGSGQTGQQIAADWHLAVSVQPSIPPTQTLQGTTIRINGGYGIELYKVSDTDSSGFNTLDNVNNMANWQQLRDDYTNWDEGCLNSTRSTTEPFDYGWGKYLGNPSYNVVGDSIYVLKTPSGNYKKLWIKKLQFDTLWQIVVANLDNSSTYQLSFSKTAQGYAGKNFVYINADNGTIANSEPAEGWDLLFGKYVDEVAPGLVYPVTGVLTNKSVKTAKAYPVDISSVAYADYETQLGNSISTIGYTWKVFANGAFSIEDSLVYYVKLANGAAYRLRFLDFRSTDGMAKFELQPVSFGASVSAVSAAFDWSFSPNPVTDQLNINSSARINRIYISDISGRLLFAVNNLNQKSGNISVSSLPKGLYLITLETIEGTSTGKLIKD